MDKGRLLAASLAATALFAGAQAFAGDSPLMVRVGVHNVDPKSNNGTILNGAAKVQVDSQVGPTINIDYYLTPNVAIDVLGALPFKHDISLNGTKSGSTKELPPTVSVQYHFMPNGRVDPYVAAGVNYTMFFEDKLDNNGPALKLKNSWGLAGQVGADFALDASRTWVLGVDLRYISIDTKAKVGGANAGTVHIDPLAYGANLGYRF